VQARPCARALALALGLNVFFTTPARADDIVATVTVDPTRVQATVDERYLSFAIDTAVLVGGAWWDGSSSTSGGRGTVNATPIDFSDAKLRLLARELSPAILRVGGTEADLCYYSMDPLHPVASPPSGFESVLTAARWDELAGFSHDLGLDLMFTLNAGKGTRDASGRWQPDQARSLLEHAQAQGQDVAVWELGNEVNAYWLTQGLFDAVSGERYARDYELARGLVRSLFPTSQVAGPSSAYWPILGEPLGFLFGVEQPFLEHVQGDVDIVTWHFYPTESSRTPFRVRPATESNMLWPYTLGEAAGWADQVAGWRDANKPNARVWVGETGPAQCGGEPGLSDTFVSTFWWLDQLGSLARHGQELQVRQDLVGADYGLLRASDLSPNPDYWSSVLWKKLMGRTVYDASVTGGGELVRAYAHGTPGGSGVTLLLLNLSETRSARITLSGTTGSQATQYQVTAAGPLSRDLFLNGAPLAPDQTLRWSFKHPDVVDSLVYSAETFTTGGLVVFP
jgi:hypothetical protein